MSLVRARRRPAASVWAGSWACWRFLARSLTRVPGGECAIDWCACWRSSSWRFGGHYLLPVKGNQPTLNKQVKAALRNIGTTPPAHTHTERSRGRITLRRMWITEPTGVGFPHAARLSASAATTPATSRPTPQQRSSTRSPATHSPRATPAHLAATARSHWTVEVVHYKCDVTWAEDAQHAYTGNGAHTLAALRNLALSVLRLNGITQIKRTLQQLSRNPTRAFALLNPQTT